MTLFGPRDEQYIRLQMYSKLGYSWVLELVGKRQQKQKREEKNKHIYKKKP